jgi:Zn-dependent peptidase ImmA (M78 family)
MRLSPAERILQELGVTDPEEIDVDAIAMHMGAVVRYRPLSGCEAHIIGRDDRAIIAVNSRSAKQRRRYSVGHELGHWHHQRGKALICRPQDIGSYAASALHPERVADGFAADLLMPGYLFAPMMRQYKRPTFEAVRALAHAFDTSIPATALRVIELGSTPALLICHSNQGRKWFRAHRDVPHHWFPRSDLDAASFAFDILHGQRAEHQPATMGADAWFDVRHAARFQLREQSIRYGEGEILTLLEITDPRMLEEW